MFALVERLAGTLRRDILHHGADGKEKIYLSKRADMAGGGSNTFAWHFERWAREERYSIARRALVADRAIVIAHLADVDELKRAKDRGCYVVHRIDEYFEKNESPERRSKHQKIIALNRCADVTVFQSRFVRDNALSFFSPTRHEVILNGGDPRDFHPGAGEPRYIGHVTWSVAERKRLDILQRTIHARPDLQFLLVGRHAESQFDFQLPNVTLRGVRNRDEIADEFRKMKLLLFPSENEPCPNTPIEAILSGVPVCYSNTGGTPEIVRDCGAPLESLNDLLGDLESYRQRCRQRDDLHFDNVFRQYMDL